MKSGLGLRPHLVRRPLNDWFAAVDLVEMAALVVLATALYVVLKPVKPEPCLTRDLLETYGDDNLCGHDPEQL